MIRFCHFLFILLYSLATTAPVHSAVPYDTNLILPPEMTDPLVIEDVCPGESGWPTPTQMAGRDLKFILPKDRDCTFVSHPENQVNFIIGGTEKNPSRNVWLIGGKIRAPDPSPQTDPGTMSWPNGMTFKFVKGTIYWEGAHIDMRCTCRDVIATANLGHYENGATLKGDQPAAKTPKLIVVNSILENPLQCTANPSIHGDVIHMQGSGTRGEVWLQNVVFRHGFQALFLDNTSGQPAGHGATLINLKNVQVYKRKEVNCQRTEGKAGTAASVLWNVAPRDGVWFDKVWMEKGATTAPGATIVNNCATYPSTAGVRLSNWCVGTGPYGDPVTADRTGRNYVRSSFEGEEPPPPTAPVFTIIPIDASVARGASGTTQQVKIIRTGDTSKPSTVNLTGTPSGTNPAITTDFSTGQFPSGVVTFEGDQPPQPLTLVKTWVATPTSQDYTYYAPANSAFVSGQLPWGAYDMAAGDVFKSELHMGANGFMRHRVITGPMRFGNGLPKGAPNITFGDHFDYRPTIRPFGDGIWSNTINELLVSVGGTGSSTGANYPCTTPCSGGYARAIQIHGFRSAYTGSGWLEAGTQDGDTYDIQIRYGTFGDYGRYSDWNGTPFERKQIGAHTWDIFETEGGWATDVGIGFELVGNAHNISNVDVRAIINYALANANKRYNRNDSAIWVRGVQVWLEPRVGAIDATIEGMTVRYNGVNYGVAQ